MQSSLLSAMLGEMEKSKGSNILAGTPAYCPQQACILNDTLKRNVTFAYGKDEKTSAEMEARYNNIIECCCLGPDLKVLPFADKVCMNILLLVILIIIIKCVVCYRSGDVCLF